MRTLKDYIIESSSRRWTRNEVLKYMNNDSKFKTLSNKHGYKIKTREMESWKGREIPCITEYGGWDWEIRIVDGKIYILTDTTYEVSHPQFIPYIVDHEQSITNKLKYAVDLGKYYKDY